MVFHLARDVGVFKYQTTTYDLQVHLTTPSHAHLIPSARRLLQDLVLDVLVDFRQVFDKLEQGGHVLALRGVGSQERREGIEQLARRTGREAREGEDAR